MKTKNKKTSDFIRFGRKGDSEGVSMLKETLVEAA